MRETAPKHHSRVQDTDIIDFGKYKGEKFGNVPASYLLWLYENDRCTPMARDYVKNNLDVLKKEANRNPYRGPHQKYGR
jgi:hypothetical protein